MNEKPKFKDPDSEQHRKIICLQQNGKSRKEAFTQVMGFTPADLADYKAEQEAGIAEQEAKQAAEALAKAQAVAEEKKAKVSAKKAPAKKAKSSGKSTEKDGDDWG